MYFPLALVRYCIKSNSIDAKCEQKGKREESECSGGNEKLKYSEMVNIDRYDD